MVCCRGHKKVAYKNVLIPSTNACVISRSLCILVFFFLRLTGPYNTRRCDLVVPADGGWGRSSKYIRLINLKRHIDYFSKGPKSSRTDRAQKRRLFRVNSILRFCHNDKHETQHVGQLISIKEHTF